MRICKLTTPYELTNKREKNQTEFTVVWISVGFGVPAVLLDSSLAGPASAWFARGVVGRGADAHRNAL